MTKSTIEVIDGVVYKKCGSCGELKPVSQFYRRADGVDGYRSECKPCWYSKNDPRSRECRDRKYREEPERYKRYRSVSYERARGDFLGCIRLALHVRRRQCREKGIWFEITAEDVAEVYEEQGGRCFLTGRELLWGLAGRHRDTLSIDRIEADDGYVRGNIRLVTYQANRARGELGDEELFEFCRTVLQYNTERGTVVPRPIIVRQVLSADNLEI